MQVFNETNYLIYWIMVSFVYSKIFSWYLLDEIQEFSLKFKCPARTGWGNSAFTIAKLKLFWQWVVNIKIKNSKLHVREDKLHRTHIALTTSLRYHTTTFGQHYWSCTQKKCRAGPELALTVKIRKSQDFLAPISGSPGDQIFLLTFRNSTLIFLNSQLWSKTAIVKLNNT